MKLHQFIRALGWRRGWKAWRNHRAIRQRIHEIVQTTAYRAAQGEIPVDDVAEVIPLNRAARRRLARKKDRS